MLRAPSGELAIHLDLAFQNARNPAIKRLLCRGFSRIIQEAKQAGCVCIAQQFHHPHHRIIVKRDVPVIPLLRWIRLRPAAGGILCLQNVVDALLNCRAIFHIPGNTVSMRKKSQLIHRGVVVKRAFDGAGITIIKLRGGVHIFRPTAFRRLMRKNVGRDRFGVIGIEPRIRLIQILPGSPITARSLFCGQTGGRQQQNNCHATTHCDHPLAQARHGRRCDRKMADCFAGRFDPHQGIGDLRRDIELRLKWHECDAIIQGHQSRQIHCRYSAVKLPLNPIDCDRWRMLGG